MTLLVLLLGIFGTSGIFVWVFIHLFVLHPEKGEMVAGWIAGAIAVLSKKAEKTATAKTIQWKIDSFVSSINTEVRGLLPFGLKIKWISPDLSKEAFIENDRVVVLLNYHQNQDENLARATVLYMQKAVVPEARPHIDRRLGKAIDLMMTKKALYSFVEARSSLGHFIDTVLRPETERDPELKELCAVIDSIDERGLLTRILLRELMELGMRRAGVIETGDTVFETSEFTKLLKKIAEKERGVDVDPTFIKNNIRMTVIMVAKPENVSHAEVYTKAVRIGLKKTARAFYLFARGDKNIEFAKEVVSDCELKFGELSKIHEEEFTTKVLDGRLVPSYCAILYNRKSA